MLSHRPKGALLRLSACLAVLSIGFATRGGVPPAGVVSLTDLNFDEALSNQRPWLITLNAHYCPLTRELEDAFERVARHLNKDGISVGRVDGTNERGLLTRFQLRQLHGVFHINGTQTRQYCEGRACEGARLSTQQLVRFATEGWKAEEPRTGCTSPVSRCGKAVGSLTKLPARFKARYLHLHEELKYSDLTLFAGLLAVPVVVRLGVICLLDAYCSRTAAPPRPVPVARLHWD